MRVVVVVMLVLLAARLLPERGSNRKRSNIFAVSDCVMSFAICNYLKIQFGDPPLLLSSFL